MSETKTVMVVGNDSGGVFGTPQARNSFSDADSDIGAPIKRSRSIFMNMGSIGRAMFADLNLG